MTPFVPSRDKYEAVNRLSSLTGDGPEELGPGSKERKRVLQNVVRFLELPVDPGLNKVALGAAIMEALGGPWGPECHSTGYTITLVGLDRVLFYATQAADALGRVADARPRSIEEEAERIVAACGSAFAEVLDMRTCVTLMKNRGDRNWAQSEWPGWYFESTGRATCMAKEGGEPGPQYGSVRFDYRLAHVWDFKAHSVRMASNSLNPKMILNDSAAIDSCVVAEGGVGFIVGHGDARYDVDGSLRQWMASMKKSGGVKSRSAKSGRSRAFKATFAMTHIDALFLPDADTIAQGLADGWLKNNFQVGFHQIDGDSPRAGKYLLDGRKMPEGILIGRHETNVEAGMYRKMAEEVLLAVEAPLMDAQGALFEDDET